MNTISKVTLRSRQLRTLLVLVVLFPILLGAHGCTFFGPIELACEEIPITVTPGTCAAFQPPDCFGTFAGESPSINASGANAQYTVIGDENIGFQFCAAEGATATSEPERVAYTITGGPFTVAGRPGTYGRGEFLVTVEQLLDATVIDSPDPVSVGSDLTYTVTLINRMPGSVFDLDMVNRLPGSVSLVSSLPSNCELQGNEIVCHGIAIVAGSVTYQFVVRPTTPGEITNELRFYDPFNNSEVTVTNTTTVNPANGADLAVTIIDNPDPVIRGATLTYTVTVTNNGPATATGVRLSDLLPPLEVFTIRVSQGSFTQPNFDQIICDFGTLASGASATLTVRGATGVSGTNINTATVTANEADPNTANNTASEPTTVNPP